MHLAPRADFLTELGHAAVEVVDGLALLDDLGGEGDRLAGELPELQPVTDEGTHDGNDGGEREEPGHGKGTGEVESHHPDSVPAHDQQAELTTATVHAAASPPGACHTARPQPAVEPATLQPEFCGF